MALPRDTVNVVRYAILSCLLLACSRGANNAPAPASRSSGELAFTGMCDASGAVPLNDTHFAVADDEDNVLRVYDATRGGPPLFAVDISDGLDLGGDATKNPNAAGKKRKKKKVREVDIEGGTRSGNLAFWITSHGRNSSGKLKPERFRFFATTAPERGMDLKVVGTPYTQLLDDLLADARFSAFGLAEASERAPKEPGGMNIEGLTARKGGGVFIGLRNPVVAGKAIVFALMNPAEVLHGQAAALSDPILLDLGGLGVRSLSSWRGRYLIVAGDFGDRVPSRLYTWDAKEPPRIVENVDFRRFNPEGFFSPETRNQILLLSDDGSVVIDDTECKRLDDPSQKRFRGLWVSVPQ